MTGPIIRLKEVIAQTGLSRSVIYDRMNEKSPRYAPDFPKSFRLGGGAIGWYKSDIDSWLAICAQGLSPAKPVAKAPAPHGNAKPGRPPSKSVRTSPSQNPPSHRDLAEFMVKGGQLYELLLSYRQMEAWTPQVGAMLLAGICPPETDSREIINGGFGLEGKKLALNNARYREAKRILKLWEWTFEDEDGQLVCPSTVNPIEFINTCIDIPIDSDCLVFLQELGGIPDPDKVDLSGARFALLTTGVKG